MNNTPRRYFRSATPEIEIASLVRERWPSQSFLRVHWGAVLPEAVCARRLN
jgi:hypothetical protein